MSGEVFCGADISLEHGAFVAIQPEDFIVGTGLGEHVRSAGIRYAFFTSVQKGAKQLGGYLVPKRADGEDKEAYAIQRREKIRGWFGGQILSFAPTYVGIEGYAYAAKNQAHQLGEIGAGIRDKLWKLNKPFRVHDPDTVKLFATGKGNAAKEEMVAAARTTWGEFSALVLGGTLPIKNLEDIADAYAVARLVYLEWKLRSGAIAMSSLTEHEIRAFNRVSKTYNENILARSWIQKI